MKKNYKKPDIKIRQYKITTTINESTQQVYNAGTKSVQYTLGTLDLDLNS